MDEQQFLKWRAWQRIIRDFAIVAVGAAMLIHEEFWAKTPNLYLIGAGLAALGIPPALRLDDKKGEDK